MDVFLVSMSARILCSFYIEHETSDAREIVEWCAYRDSRSRWLKGAAATGVFVCVGVLDLQSRKSNLPA